MDNSESDDNYEDGNVVIDDMMRHTNDRYSDNERLETLFEEEQQYERMKSIKTMSADVDNTEDYKHQEEQPVIKR